MLPHHPARRRARRPHPRRAPARFDLPVSRWGSTYADQTSRRPAAAVRARAQPERRAEWATCRSRGRSEERGAPPASRRCDPRAPDELARPAPSLDPVSSREATPTLASKREAPAQRRSPPSRAWGWLASAPAWRPANRSASRRFPTTEPAAAPRTRRVWERPNWEQLGIRPPPPFAAVPRHPCATRAFASARESTRRT